MSELELKPCPFCGSKRVGMSHGRTASWIKDRWRGKIRAITCGNCGCFGGVFDANVLDEDEAEEKAVESWNRRV